MSAPPGLRGFALLAVAAAALTAGSAAPAAERPAVKHVSIAGLGHGGGPVRSRVLTHVPRRFASIPPTAWGGVYTTRSGARVTVYTSKEYPVNPAANQAAADFVDSLVHGPEISTVRIYIAPPLEVGIHCHTYEADGCYFTKTNEIYTIGQDTPWSTVEEVLAHEYGHHIANSRDNYPWPAIAYGTKRWATHMAVCQKEAEGKAFPGDEGEHYFQNPGEAFAESYLHLNIAKLGLAQIPWFYDPIFTPDAAALAAIEQDVLKPWKQGALKRWSGRFARRGQHLTRTFGTPLDGVFAAQLRGPRASTLALGGLADVKRVSPSLSAGLICGQRSVTTTFVAGAKGRYAAAAALP